MDIIAFVGLAALDAINPFSIGILLVLLLSDRPLERGGVFIGVTAVTYFFGGLVLLNGWSFVASEKIPEYVSSLARLVAGLICVLFCVKLIRSDAPLNYSPAETQPHHGTLVATAILSIISTASDLPTAIPYIAAAKLLTDAGGPLFLQVIALATYNVVYVSPLVALLLVRRNADASLDITFHRAKTLVQRSFKLFVPPLIGLLGVYLSVDGTLRLGAQWNELEQ
jgi:hypothetical protein